MFWSRSRTNRCSFRPTGSIAASTAALYDQEHEQIWLFYTGADVTKRDIAVALRADLPGFMVPRKIEQLDAMPRLDNGKTDMRALAGRIADAHR